MINSDKTEDTVKGILKYLQNLPSEERNQVLLNLRQEAAVKKGVTVSSVVEITGAEKEQIFAFVKAKGYKPEEVNFNLDKNLLGGLTIRLGDNLIDRSLASLLAQYQSKFT